MAFIGRRVTVTTDPTLLNSVDADQRGGSSILVRVPVGGTTVDLGGPAVVAGAGFPLGAGDAMPADAHAGDRLYGIVAAGTQEVYVLESGV